MRLHVLGGGNEVGASMLLVEVGGLRVVFDCGIRMGASGSALPDLAGMGDAPIDAVVLTHAHMDHCGALPLLHSSMPRVPIFATPATRDLVRVMLGDALRVMDERLAREQELPLYPPEAVQSMLSMVTTVPLGATVRVGPEESVALTFMPAGHILGAAMIGVQCGSERLLVTGDVSLDEQSTVLGMVPPAQPYGCLVMESTYGGRLHSDRQTEVNRFVAKVAEVTGRGGKMLVPAFALGRSQELLLILLQAMSKGELPPVHVWADGLVREVCGCYGRFAAELPRFARKRAEKHGSPFFGGTELVQPVTGGTAQRDQILAGPPCVIVSSSGMLTGGPSQYYARMLAQDPANCISLTGYQDEESPGRRLQEMASTGSRTLPIQGGSVEVLCEVATYGLSAHADGHQLLQLVRRVRPEHAVLVHGDAEARQWLAARVSEAEVYQPANGAVLQLDLTVRRDLASPRQPLSGGRPLTPDTAPELAATLRREGHEGRPISLARILDRWYGPGAWGESELDSLPQVLDDSPDFDDPELRRPDLRTVVPEGEAEQRRQEAIGPWAQHRVTARVEQVLPKSVRIRRIALFPDRHHCTLCFDLPRVAARLVGEPMAQLQAETGWTFDVDSSPNLTEVMAQASRVLKESTEVAKLGVDLVQGVVKAKVDPLPPPAQIARLEEAVLEATGYKLLLEQRTGPLIVASVPPSGVAMEINATYALIRQAFASCPTPPSKVGLRQDSIGSFVEVRFVTPEVGQRYRPELDLLASQVCRRIEYAPNCVPQELQQLATACLGDLAGAVGLPSVYPQNKLVRVPCPPGTDPAAIASAQARFLDLTGWTLAVG